MTHPTIGDVAEAADRIAGVVRATPLVSSPSLSQSGPVRLKAECLQETGSFKVRGAANALLSRDPESVAGGVVAVSSGNHGRAVAYVARLLEIPATVCVSARVPPYKVEAIEDLGARVLVGGPDQDDADALARRLVAEQGLEFIHPFDDPAVIAGQGTIGLEILGAMPDCSTIVVPLSGGGLIAGIAVAAKGRASGITVVGVSQDRGPAMHRSLEAGHLVDVVEEDTLADALAGGLGPTNRHTFEMCRLLVDRTVLVSEVEMARAMRFLHEEHGWRVEGGGAVGVAALLAGRVEAAGPTAVVVSGGNVGEAVFRRALDAADPRP